MDQLLRSKLYLLQRISKPRRFLRRQLLDWRKYKRAKAKKMYRNRTRVIPNEHNTSRIWPQAVLQSASLFVSPTSSSFCKVAMVALSSSRCRSHSIRSCLQTERAQERILQRMLQAPLPPPTTHHPPSYPMPCPTNLRAKKQQPPKPPPHGTHTHARTRKCQRGLRRDRFSESAASPAHAFQRLPVKHRRPECA